MKTIRRQHESFLSWWANWPNHTFRMIIPSLVTAEPKNRQVELPFGEISEVRTQTSLLWKLHSADLNLSSLNHIEVIKKHLPRLRWTITSSAKITPILVRLCVRLCYSTEKRKSPKWVSAMLSTWLTSTTLKKKPRLSKKIWLGNSKSSSIKESSRNYKKKFQTQLMLSFLHSMMMLTKLPVNYQARPLPKRTTLWIARKKIKTNQWGNS